MCHWMIVSDIAIFVLKRDVKLQLTVIEWILVITRLYRSVFWWEITQWTRFARPYSLCPVYFWYGNSFISLNPGWLTSSHVLRVQILSIRDSHRLSFLHCFTHRIKHASFTNLTTLDSCLLSRLPSPTKTCTRSFYADRFLLLFF